MTTWALLAVAGEEKTIMVFNTHLDYDSAKARELGAKLISDRLSLLDLSASYLFFTGDFNTAPDTLPREIFRQQLPNRVQLLDALSGMELEQQMSYHEFSGKAFAAIDTIYYDSRVSLGWAKVDGRSWQGILPSDHFAVIAEFTFG
jgi:endonuclease/exonuclease/phosphatase family metal-dependent hydrolase